MSNNPPINSRLRRLSLAQTLWEFVQARWSIYQFALRLQEKYGSAVWLPFGLPAYVLNDGADLRHILITNAENYEKVGALVFAKKFLGDGLLTSEGTTHHRHRRAMQPMFHRQMIQGFAESMVDCAQQRSAAWHNGQPRDMTDEMMHIASSIISRALFSIDLEYEARELSDAIVMTQKCIVERIRMPLWLPYFTAARERRYDEAVERVDRSLMPILRERMQPTAPKKQDMLNMLMEIRFEDGGQMSEKEIRDEIITIFLAGHETSANALAWTLYLLHQNPDILAKLHQELDTVLQGRLPTMADLANLPYTEAVMWETLRMYPPVWLLGRFALKEDVLPSGVRVEKGSQVLISPWATHRNPIHFPEPTQFKPERFFEKVGIAQAYIPFSTGIRSCVGEPFAKMEIVLVLATLCQQFNFKLEPGQDIRPGTLIVLRPIHGIRMRAEKRSPATV